MMRRSMSVFATCCALALFAVACSSAKDTGFPPVATTSPSAAPVACGGPDTPVQYSNPIDVCDNGYTPKLTEVAAGTTVEWDVSGSAPHSITFDNGAFDSNPKCSQDPTKCTTSGDKFTFAVNLKPGKYHYYCRIHGAKGLDTPGTMYGYLIVTGGSGGSTASPTGGATSTSTAAPAPSTTKVAATDQIAFDPKSVSIHVGDTVTWTSGANVPHTATSQPGAPEKFDVNLPAGASGSFKFTKAGTYKYYCKIHGPSMSGTIVVTA